MDISISEEIRRQTWCCGLGGSPKSARAPRTLDHCGPESRTPSPRIAPERNGLRICVISRQGAQPEQVFASKKVYKMLVETCRT